MRSPIKRDFEKKNLVNETLNKSNKKTQWKASPWLDQAEERTSGLEDKIDELEHSESNKEKIRNYI
jgi:hypothetical protein